MAPDAWLRGTMHVGDDIDDHPPSAPAARCDVAIRLSRSDLVDAWGRCGSTANFLARFLLSDPSSQVLCSTVFNEIIENAAKYAAVGRTSIELGAWREGGEVGINARHLVEDEQLQTLTSWVARIREEELDTLIERTAAAAEDMSRLGLLTLLRDYGARLSVRVAPFLGAPQREVTVQLVLPSLARYSGSDTTPGPGNGAAPLA